MKIAVSSTSFAAALAVMAPKHSNAAMAAAVDAAYENMAVEQAAEEHVKTRSLGEECSFASSGLRRNDADTGILSCGVDFVCIEDGRSSLGGVCVSADLKHRELQNTAACTAKCTGTDACKGTDAAIINALPDGSCCGYKACAYLTGTISIGAGSCLGAYSCYKAKDATIGKGSCTGDSIQGPDTTSKYAPYYGFSCAYMQGTVGDDSCFEYSACFQYYSDGYKFNIGSDSCIGQTSCAYSANTAGTLKIGSSSCTGYYACYSMTAGVGDGSCNAAMACEYSSGYIGPSLCNTNAECRNNTAIPTAAPTNSPTKSPTNSPTNLTTHVPTAAKSTKSTKTAKDAGTKSVKTTKKN